MANKTISDLTVEEFIRTLKATNFNTSNSTSRSISASDEDLDKIYARKEAERKKLVAKIDSEINSLNKKYNNKLNNVFENLYDGLISEEQAYIRVSKIAAEKRLVLEEKNLEKLHKEQENARAKEQDAHRRLIAQKIKAENAYKEASLDGKRRIREQETADAKERLDQLNFLRLNLVKLSADELEEEKELQKKIEKNHQLELNFLEAEHEAKKKNLPLDERLVFLQENLKRAVEEKRDAQEEYDKNLLIAEKEYGKDSKEYKEIKAKEEEKLKQRNEEIDSKYGTNSSDAIKGAGLSILTQGLGIDLSGITETIQLIMDAFAGNPLGLIIKILSSIVSAMKKIYAKIGEGVDEYAQLQTSYLAKVNTRLVGLDERLNSFDKITTFFTTTLGTSKFVSQKSLIETMASFVESGVAYNLEQRTIIAELSNRMVSTFDALDETLLRLNRLQQADNTIPSMVSENLLTELLNENFQDTSYLSNEYDSINGILLEAMSQMKPEEALPFMYNIQKWLGSLYALGMSGSGVEKIAEGINYLATGNLDLLNDDSLLNLFSLASNGSISDMLVNGVNADNINILLSNIVDILGDISTDTNKVTKSVRSGVFGGLAIGDLTAVNNLTPNQFSSIYNASTSWDYAKNEGLTKLLDMAEANTSIADKVNNFVDNILYSYGQMIVESTLDAKYKDTQDHGDYQKEVYKDTLAGTLGIAGESGYLQWKLGEKFDNVIGLGLQADALARAQIQAGDNAVGLNTKAGLKGLLAGFTDNSRLGIITKASGKDWVRNNRGGLFNTDTRGVQQGISNSVLASIDGLYTGMSLYEAAQTLADNGITVSGNTGNTSLKSVDDLYTALFVNKQTVRVSVAALESQAQTDLSKTTITANKDDIKDIRENISRFKDDTGYKLDEIYRKMVLGY